MDEMSENIGALLREVADSMRALDDRKTWFPPREDLSPAVSDFEERLAAKYRDAPPLQLSAELRTKLGCGVKRVAAE